MKREEFGKREEGYRGGEGRGRNYDNHQQTRRSLRGVNPDVCVCVFFPSGHVTFVKEVVFLR